MRRIDDYSDDELVQLDEAAVARLVDLECAHEGVPLLPPAPGDAPVKPDVGPDTTVFKVDYSGDLLLAAREDALEIADLIGERTTVQLSYRSGPSYDRVIRERGCETPKVSEVEVFSEAYADEHRHVLDAYEQEKRRHGKLREAYDGALRARQDVADRVRERVEEACAAERRLLTAREKFARYVELAEGDEVVAFRFFEKAEAALLEDQRVRDVLEPADYPRVAEEPAA